MHEELSSSGLNRGALNVVNFLIFPKLFGKQDNDVFILVRNLKMDERMKTFSLRTQISCEV